jgi:protein-tyrosine-phosphatase/predicted ATP-grasp superfamily ATP-dependent carboligase
MARALRRECGVEIDMVYLSERAPRVKSRAIRAGLSVPDFRKTPDQFIEKLVELIRTRQFDTCFPIQDAAVTAIVQHYAVLSSLVHVGCPPPQVVERVQNKKLTLEFAKRCGIPVPQSFAVCSTAELDGVAERLTFPVVMKPSSTGTGPFKVRYLHTIDELKRALPENPGRMLLQEYHRGVGVGVEMLVHNGECVAVFQHRRLKEEPASGGVAVMAIAEKPDPVLAEAALQLLRAIEWEGVAMVEFRKDPANGRFALLEVNGRYWGTSSLPILAGMNFPVYHWRVLHDQDSQVPDSYAVGMRWRWTPGYISRLHGLFLSSAEKVDENRPSKMKEMLDVPRDLSPFIRDAVWSWSDPLPAIIELFQTLGEWAKADLKWLARKLVPKSVLRDRNVYYQLKPSAARIYLRLKVLDKLRFGFGNRRKVPSGARSFVFVCHGNIMRSPIAATMFQRELTQLGIADVAVCSAGLHARDGREAHPWGQTAASELGIPLDHHRAQRLTPEMVKQADVIFAMDFENKAELLDLYPDAQHKIVLLSAYGERGVRYREIPDPFHADLEGTRECYKCLQTCIRNLTANLFHRLSRSTLAERSAVTS